MTDRAYVQSASSAKQVKRAERAEKRAAFNAAEDVAAVMAEASGRRFVWWLLAQCKTFESVMRDGAERVQYHAGRQDVGHLLQAHVIATRPDLYLRMQQEAIDAAVAEQATAPTEAPGMLAEPPDSSPDAGDGEE